MLNFSDHVVLVTGGSGNLGRVVVRAFQTAGANLVVVDRSSDRLQQLFPELANSAHHYLAGGVGVTQPGFMEKLVAETMERFGRVDALVNTVGGYRAGMPLHQTAPEDLELMLTLNVRAAFYTCRAVIPAMLARGRGKIVNVGAHASLAGAANEAAYSASKGALARLTESMAAEYKRSGINVNAVLPAAMVKADVLAATPDAGVTPEDVTQVIMFLCSDAARIIHGALIPAFGLHF